jgi:hypothetical protein
MPSWPPIIPLVAERRIMMFTVKEVFSISASPDRTRLALRGNQISKKWAKAQRIAVSD